MSTNHLLTNDELTQHLKQGDEAAFTHIYNKYWDKLYYIAHRLLRDTDAAEKIVQEIFSALWKKKQ